MDNDDGKFHYSGGPGKDRVGYAQAIDPLEQWNFPSSLSI